MAQVTFEAKLPFPSRKAHVALRDQLLEYLLRERPKVGDLFLSDHDLVKISKLSRPTVRRALDDLSREGWIERRHGRGTYIGPRMGLTLAPQRAVSRPSQKATGRVAVLVHFPGSFHFDWQSTGILDGMDAVASAQGISIELLGSRDGSPDNLARRLAQSRPDVLACLSPRPPQAFLIAEARRMGIPTILTGSRLIGLHLPTVREDGIAGARDAVRYLVSKGHRRIGFMQLTVAALWAFERREGYVAGMREAGLEPDENLTMWLSEEANGHGAATVRSYLERQRPTAVLLGSSGLLTPLYEVVASDKIRVPQDLSVVHFDQRSEGTRWFEGATTTAVELPLQEMGRQLVELSRRAIDGQAIDSPPLIPCRLVEGDSVGSLS